jgi:hypothetical protein
VVVPIHLTEPCFTEYGGNLRHVRGKLREVTVRGQRGEENGGEGQREEGKKSEKRELRKESGEG